MLLVYNGIHMSITRKKNGKSFKFFENGIEITDKHVISRIKSLAIPPAWGKVEISSSASSKVQAKGVDKAGRVQMIYHPRYRARQEVAKFNKILDFAVQLPKLRKQIDKDLSRKKLTEEKVVACIVKLIDKQYFRVGNEQYAKQNQSYGITTLRSKHTEISSSTVTFNFVGKSGKQHTKKISDAQLARIIKQLDDMPGYEIFRYIDDSGTLRDIHSDNVNRYIKKYAGDQFSAKDFRTWGGTLLAASAIIAEDIENVASEKSQAKVVRSVIKRVARKLGNTPSVAKQSYIDPKIFDRLKDGKSIPALKESMNNIKPKST